MGACCATVPIDDNNDNTSAYNNPSSGTHVSDSSTSFGPNKKIILTPKGYLTDIPSWFPVANAHKDIKKVFTRHEVIGRGVTGILYTNHHHFDLTTT